MKDRFRMFESSKSRVYKEKDSTKKERDQAPP